MDWGLLLTGIGTVTALVFGIWGVIAGVRAERHAKEAQDHSRRLHERVTTISGELTELRKVSEDARDLAKDANATRDRQLDALTEEHVVSWHHEWEGYGSYRVEHTGRHDALNARAIVMVDGRRQVVECERIGPGGSIHFEFPEARLKEEAEDRERRRIENTPGPLGVTQPYFPKMFTTSFEIHWRSPAGVQHSYGPKQTTQSY